MQCVRLVGLSLMFAVVVAACSGDDSSSEPIFGTQDSACTSVRLQNEENDADLVEQATDCLLGEIDAGRPVTVDIAGATVEGDPIYNRYAFDGERVLVVQDSRADEFGLGGVLAMSCGGVAPTGWIPEGVDCEAADHNGFPEAG